LSHTSNSSVRNPFQSTGYRKIREKNENRRLIQETCDFNNKTTIITAQQPQQQIEIRNAAEKKEKILYLPFDIIQKCFIIVIESIGVFGPFQKFVQSPIWPLCEI
jgi:hypothetical protein